VALREKAMKVKTLGRGVGRNDWRFRPPNVRKQDTFRFPSFKRLCLLADEAFPEEKGKLLKEVERCDTFIILTFRAPTRRKQLMKDFAQKLQEETLRNP